MTKNLKEILEKYGREVLYSRQVIIINYLHFGKAYLCPKKEEILI